jgi:hypothetical protein
MAENEQKVRTSDDEILWGAAAIGEAINRDRRSTYHLIYRGLIDVTQVGSSYISTRRRLNRSLGIE